MTRNLFEAYKSGRYRPYNRYFIETYKAVYIPRHKTYFGWEDGKNDVHIPVTDQDLVNITFNGSYITFSISHVGVCFDTKKRRVYEELLPPYTVTVNYKNIKAFH